MSSDKEPWETKSVDELLGELDQYGHDSISCQYGTISANLVIDYAKWIGAAYKRELDDIHGETGL